MHPRLLFLVALLAPPLALYARSPETPWEIRRHALLLELQVLRENPGEFYLLVDLALGEIHLKADANLLRVCPIREVIGPELRQVQYTRFAKRIDPVTIEPGNGPLRHRGRILPMDFVDRLTEGSRTRSRLFFSPGILLQPAGIPFLPSSLTTLFLDPRDIHALGAALSPGHLAILIPPGASEP